ncbi:MAG: alpha/beta hydrolase family protein [Bdellovibrionales bacterium]
MNIQYLDRDTKPRLAYSFSPAKDGCENLPTVMFCGGFRSDMNGTKATFLEDLCVERGQAYLRFDYSGHGQSGGDFKDGTIGAWFNDTLDIFNAIINGPVIIVGSSMGGWIGLLFAQVNASFVKGFIGIAAAPDFTARLYDEELNDDQRQNIIDNGYLEVANEYSDEPYIFTAGLFEDGKNHFILDAVKTNAYPITLLHGLKDSTVPREVPEMIKANYKGGPLDIIYIDDGDHSLSRHQDLEILKSELIGMSDSRHFINVIED